jgi:hypothetical protein
MRWRPMKISDSPMSVEFLGVYARGNQWLISHSNSVPAVPDQSQWLQMATRKSLSDDALADISPFMFISL